MAQSLTITRSWNFPAGRPVTLAALRLGALPSGSISGSIGAGDIADGAITPPKVSPGAYFYGPLIGTNDYALILNPPLTGYADGVEVLGKVANTNTNIPNPPTLSVQGLGPKNIYHRSGLVPKPGDMVANDIIRFRYNTSRNSGAGGWDIWQVTPSATIRPATNDTTGTANVQAVVNTPPLVSYNVGQILAVKVGVGLTNTGQVTLNCDGLGARNVRRPGGDALLVSEWVAGVTYFLYDDGTQFTIIGKDRKVAIVAATRNLIIQSIGTTQASITADEVVLKYGGAVVAPVLNNGLPLLVSNVNLVVDIALGVNLNGFESGAVRNPSRWYYIWLLSDGTNVRAVLEDAGPPDGALPAGPDLSNPVFAAYPYLALVGHLRLNATGSGEIVPFVQRDRSVWFEETNIFAGRVVTAANTYQVLAVGADLTNFRSVIPPTAARCSGTFGVTSNNQLLATLSGCSASGAVDPAGIGAQNLLLVQLSAQQLGFFAAAPFDIPVRGGLNWNIQWKATAGAIQHRLNLSGYTF